MTCREYGVADLAGAVRPWRNRFGLGGTLKWSMRGLGGGLGLAVALLVAARFVPWPDVFLWCAVATAVGTVAGVLYGLLSAPSLEAASRQADRLLGLSDRLGTAWELRCVSSPFAELQRRDALVSTRNRDPGEAVRIWPGRSHFLPVVIGLALIGLLVALPNPLDLVIQQQGTAPAAAGSGKGGGSENQGGGDGVRLVPERRGAGSGGRGSGEARRCAQPS